jgi:hypothetical protein
MQKLITWVRPPNAINGKNIVPPKTPTYKKYMWHVDNLIRNLLKTKHPLNINKQDTNFLKKSDPIFTSNTFISCQEITTYKVCHKKWLSVDGNTPLLSIDGNLVRNGPKITFTRTENLSSKDFEDLLTQYTTYLYSTFKHNLNLFRVVRSSENTFSLILDTLWLVKGNCVCNYLDYLSILSVSPLIKLISSDFNQTPQTYTPQYKTSIINASVSTQNVAWIVGVPTRNTTYLGICIKSYMFIYEKNSEYFLRVGCITCLNPSNYHLYEKYFQSLYHGLWDLLGETRSPDIGVSNSQIDTHSVINISQADYYDWDVLTTLPEHITHLEQPSTQVLWGGI